MNVLIVGSNKSDLIEYLPDTFLIAYDGELTVPLPERRKVTRLDLSQHAFNPLKNINYKRARDFLAVLNSVFPEGENTLTKKSANFVLLKALLSHPTRLDKLLHKPDKNDPGALDAYQKIQTLLLSPALRPFLCKPTNFSLQGIVLAPLDPAVITEFDAFVIGNLLISNYEHTVVIPDFGMYACKFHLSLLRQGRLVVAVNHLGEVPWLTENLHHFHKIIPSHCTAKDAATLADYCSPFPRGTDGYQGYLQEAMA